MIIDIEFGQYKFNVIFNCGKLDIIYSFMFSYDTNTY